MIKIFQGTNPIELEKQANNFMQEIGKDCPVREEVLDGTFILVVFYNGVKTETPIGNTPSDIISIQPDKPKSDKIGAFWKAKDGGVRGSIEIEGENKKIVINSEKWEGMETVDTKAGDKMKLGELPNGDKFRVIVNKFKKESKHPDFVIMRVD